MLKSCHCCGRPAISHPVFLQQHQRYFVPGQETSLQTLFASFLNCGFSGCYWRLCVSAVGNSLHVNILYCYIYSFL